MTIVFHGNKKRKFTPILVFNIVSARFYTIKQKLNASSHACRTKFSEHTSSVLFEIEKWNGNKIVENAMAELYTYRGKLERIPKLNTIFAWCLSCMLVRAIRFCCCCCCFCVYTLNFIGAMFVMECMFSITQRIKTQSAIVFFFVRSFEHKICRQFFNKFLM